LRSAECQFGSNEVQSKPQSFSRSVSLKSAARLSPYVLVILLCLFSSSALQVGLSESDSSQTKALPATAVDLEGPQSTFVGAESDHRFDLFGKGPANQPFAFSGNSSHSYEQSTDSADGVWRNVKESEIGITGGRAAGPKTYRTLTLSRAKLTTILAGAPLEFSNKDVQPALLTLPSADGTFQSFRVVESPIMEPALAARFPEIKTYSGQGVDDLTATTRFDWTPQGFHALILSSKGTVLIEPYNADTTANYIAYFQREVPISSFACDVSEAEQENAIAESKRLLSSRGLQPEVSSDSKLRTYRLAVAATAEYTQKYGGGTVTGAFSAITTTVNSVNAIYQTELAIKLVFVANETDIIFTDPATDGYTSDNPSALISENQTKLDSVIGAANYDIGHVFDGRSEAPGFFSFQGLASIASVCRDGFKARGVSITRSVQPSSVVAYYSTAHEMGHQFGATHTFNATTGSCATQRTGSTAYEPGTGSTIMGYRFACGAEDLMSSDTYFHNASLEQIVNYTTLGSGSSCPVLTATTNSAPAVDAGPAYTIPQGTPFTLGALGSDANGDDLTFCWEEFDLGAASPPSTDDGSRPIFRSFAPVSNPSRTFPRVSDILNGFPAFGESLPVTTRTMNFRVTARDNRFSGGGIGSAATQVSVRADSGPFVVTQPASGASWTIGSSQTITWNVANTDLAPVSCSRVRILMSINGGSSFPFVIADDTANDGSETVTLPVTDPTGTSASARIKIVGRGNIFFNISAPFKITLPASSIQFSSSSYSASEGDNPKQFNITVTRTGDVSGGATAEYDTSDSVFGVPCNVLTGERALSRCDYESAIGQLYFAPGEASKTITIPVIDDSYAEGVERFQMELRIIVGASFGNPTQATLTINDNDAAPGQNQIDQASYFVRQHYIDFLNREPDSSGLAFWTDQIAQCGTDAQCIEIKRINVSAAFYLSIEFQETGFLAYRLYKAMLGDANGTSTTGGQHSLKVPVIRLDEFVGDTRRLSEGVIVGQPGWEQVLENNKQKFLNEFIQRIRFTGVTGLTPAKFVDTLNTNAGNPLSIGERNQLVADLTFGVKTQAQVLRAVVEDSDLVAAEKNRAFVLMQYFGYLRRNPNDTPDSDYSGYEFWLNKLNEFGGNFVNAEMVKAFITSGEYRQRFGP
jgi:hypothetical protein